MRSILYKKLMTDGSTSVHYVTLERIDHFTFSEKDSKTIMYAISNNSVHTLSESVKIENSTIVMKTLLNLTDRIIVDIDNIIKDSNELAKSKKKGK